MNPHTVSGMYFEGPEATHATPHHHHVGSGVFVYPLNDLVVQVSVVEVILVDRQPPRMRQATHQCHPGNSVHCTAFNLGKWKTKAKRKTLLKADESGLWWVARFFQQKIIITKHNCRLRYLKNYTLNMYIPPLNQPHPNTVCWWKYQRQWILC